MTSQTHTHSRRNEGSISRLLPGKKQQLLLERPHRSILEALRPLKFHQHSQGNTALGTSAGRPERRPLRTSQEGDLHPPCIASTLPSRLLIRAPANVSCGRLSWEQDQTVSSGLGLPVPSPWVSPNLHCCHKTPVESVRQVPQSESKTSKEGDLLEPVVELLTGAKY